MSKEARGKDGEGASKQPRKTGKKKKKTPIKKEGAERHVAFWVLLTFFDAFIGSIGTLTIPSAAQNRIEPTVYNNCYGPTGTTLYTQVPAVRT